MAGVTECYGLATGVVADDLIEPHHHNRVADTLDQVLGGFLKRMMADGAHTGWGLSTAGTVEPGAGLVSGCWGTTIEAQAVTGLVPNAVNYVFGGVDETSAPLGTVRFFAQLSATKPPGAVLLGTMTVDGAGEVASVDEEVAGADRNCARLEIGTARGNGVEEDVAAQGEAEISVEHDPQFLVPGALEVTVSSPDFTWEVRESYRGDRFLIVATNTGSEAADFVYAWTRRGFVA